MNILSHIKSANKYIYLHFGIGLIVLSYGQLVSDIVHTNKSEIDIFEIISVLKN